MLKRLTKGNYWVFQNARISFVVILAFTIGCDQTSKYIARKMLHYSESISLLGGMCELRLVENAGSFLSLGASIPEPFRFLLFTVVMATGLSVLSMYLISVRKLKRLTVVGLSLVCAGGLSNLIDRVTQHGRVTDFAYIRVGYLHTGVFNLADVIIVAGVMALGFSYEIRAGKPAMHNSEHGAKK